MVAYFYLIKTDLKNCFGFSKARHGQDLEGDSFMRSNSNSQSQIKIVEQIRPSEGNLIREELRLVGPAPTLGFLEKPGLNYCCKIYKVSMALYPFV